MRRGLACDGDRLSVGVLQKPAYVKALTSLLDKAPGWTWEVLKTNGSYKSSPRFTAEIDGISYEIFNMCVKVQRTKCAGALVLMFAPNGTSAWGGLRQDGPVSYLGTPGEAQLAVLKRELYVPPTPAKTTGPYLFDVIEMPAYNRALASLRDPAGKLPSLIWDVLKKDSSYNSTPALPVAIDGATYEIFSVCYVEFSCVNTRMIVMFAPNGARAWVLLLEDGTISDVGAPSDAQLQVMTGALEAHDPKWGSGASDARKP